MEVGILKIAIYVRVSTKDQTIEQQETKLKEFAKARDWTVTNTFRDEGMSARKIDRPGYLKLMDAARKRLIDGVLVFRFDRFARSLKQLINGLEEFNQLGVAFISYSENLDTTTPSGRALFQLIGVFAEFERDMISEATKHRLQALKNLGVKLGRPQKVNPERVIKYRKDHPEVTQRHIAKVFKVSPGTITRILKETSL